MKGAEAVVTETEIIGIPAVRKTRIGKKYRLSEIDSRLRKERTRSEARLLNKLKQSGIRCPVVLAVFEYELILSKIDGMRPEMTGKECMEAGRILAKMHEDDIIHGDFTPANLISNDEGLFVIDLGLGFVSKEIEDKAVDVFTMLRSIDCREEFLSGYSEYGKYASVMKRVKKVESRVRYAF